MHKQRRTERLQACEDRVQTSNRVNAGESSGGQRQADAAAGKRTIDIVWVGAVQRNGTPHAKWILQR
jgi:hypothetical protein